MPARLRKCCGSAAVGLRCWSGNSSPHFLAWDPVTLGKLSDQIYCLLFSFLINKMGIIILPAPQSCSFHKYLLSTDFMRSVLLGGEDVAYGPME